ncbi:MAG: LemA family protein [Desulfarculaceae bacterium]|jgi:LemA protein
MSRGVKIIIGIGVVLAVIFLSLLGIYSYVKGTYNSLVSMDQGVNTAWSNIDTVLQRRLDLIPNLVETVKGYAAHEKETLQAVIQARSKATGAASINEKIAANQMLSSALGRLLLVVERYPDLKASANFRQLQDELAGTENRINVARTRYNKAVQEYNTKVKSFPTTLLAGMFGFSPRDYFKAAPEAATAPKVKFK